MSENHQFPHQPFAAFTYTSWGAHIPRDQYPGHERLMLGWLERLTKAVERGNSSVQSLTSGHRALLKSLSPLFAGLLEPLRAAAAYQARQIDRLLLENEELDKRLDALERQCRAAKETAR